MAMITLACNWCARDTSRAVVCQHSTWRAWSSLRTKTVTELAQSICSNYFLPTLISRYLVLNFETCNFLTCLVVELTLMKFERKYVARLLWAPPTPTDNFEIVSSSQRLRIVQTVMNQNSGAWLNIRCQSEIHRQLKVDRIHRSCQLCYHLNLEWLTYSKYIFQSYHRFFVFILYYRLCHMPLNFRLTLGVQLRRVITQGPRFFFYIEFNTYIFM